MRMHIPMGRMVSVGERLSQFGVEYSNRSSRRGQPAQCVDKIQTNSVIVTLRLMTIHVDTCYHRFLESTVQL